MLVRMRIKWSLRNKRKVSERKRYYSEKLRHSIAVDQFKLKILNRYEVLEDNPIDDVKG